MTLLLSRSEILALTGYAEVIDAVEKVHAELARGGAVQPAPGAVSLPGTDAVFLPMTGVSATARAMGVKLLADIPANGDRGLPVQRSTLMITDAETGACEAILDGAAVTGLRTAAASAVATRHLARAGSRVLGLVGAGNQARARVAAIRCVLPIERVVVWNRGAARARALVDELRESGLEASVAPDIASVAGGVDVLCTLTPSREPLVRGAWFADGLHVNAVGAPPRSDHREIDTEGIRRSRVVVDSYATALHKSGDVMIPVAEGAIGMDHFADELGAVIVGASPGRRDDTEITLYNSVGVGLQDLATARLVIDKAVACGAGTHVDLSR